MQLTERDDVRDKKAHLDRESNDIVKRLRRLRTAVEMGGEMVTLMEGIRELEDRQRAIDRELRRLRPVPRLATKVIEDRLAEWRRLLRQSTTQGRAVLQRVLCGRITFIPTDEGYTFEAPTRFDRLFTGVVCERPSFVRVGDARGTEDIGPEDTFDGDYGRLLEAAQERVKGLASPSVPSWNTIHTWLRELALLEESFGSVA